MTERNTTQWHLQFCRIDSGDRNEVTPAALRSFLLSWLWFHTELQLHVMMPYLKQKTLPIPQFDVFRQRCSPGCQLSESWTDLLCFPCWTSQRLTNIRDLFFFFILVFKVSRVMAVGSTGVEERDGRTFGSQRVKMCVSVFATLIISVAGKSWKNGKDFFTNDGVQVEKEELRFAF